MSAKQDLFYINKAIFLASKVFNLASPDPAVAAIIVKKNKIISSGYHDKFATPHAEEFAIKKAGKKAKGATLYINLEPCCHYGNNPPCTDIIIRSGIKRVVASMRDPNPLVNGRGFAALKKSGIKVDIGLMKKEAESLNRNFIKYITKKMPYVTLKLAMTLDGKIATQSGDSLWITSKRSRTMVHELRRDSDAVMVGANTAIKDDPELTVRFVKTKKQPKRIIVDGMARISPGSLLLKNNPQRTIIIVSDKASQKKVDSIKKTGAEVLKLKGNDGRIDLKYLMRILAQKRISSVLIEGGGNLAADALSSKVVDRIILFIAPKILGGKNALTPVEGIGVKKLKDAMIINNLTFGAVGKDLIVEGEIKRG